MKTEPLYLSDPYLKSYKNTTVIEIVEFGNEASLILDKTIFYPMGGGQATDQGFIIDEAGSRFEVYQVLLKDGEINHFVKNTSGLDLGSSISLEINWDRRYKNMQLHSGGHIIDFAIYLLGYSPNLLKPLKGDHNKNPHIEYLGEVDHDITQEVQQKVNEIIDEDLQFNWEFVDFETLKSKAIYLQPNLPLNKPLRMLELETVGAVADGGTIVRKTSEISSIKITAIETIDGNTLVKYSL